MKNFHFFVLTTLESWVVRTKNGKFLVPEGCHFTADLLPQKCPFPTGFAAAAAQLAVFPDKSRDVLQRNQ